MARLQKEKQAAVTTGLAEQPAFPARWVERLLRALPGDRACLPPSSGCRRPRHQRRGVGTTRLDRPLEVVRPHAKRALRPQAATASPAPRSVTIAKRPFSEQETARSIDLICPTTQGRICPTECDKLARRAVWVGVGCGELTLGLSRCVRRHRVGPSARADEALLLIPRTTCGFSIGLIVDMCRLASRPVMLNANTEKSRVRTYFPFQALCLLTEAGRSPSMTLQRQANFEKPAGCSSVVPGS